VVSLSLSACSNRDARRRYAEAQKLFDAGDYLGAVHGFELVVVDHPDSDVADHALYLVGQIYALYFHQYDRAQNAYQRLVQNYPRSADAPAAQLARAEIFHYKSEDYARALQEYHRLLTLFPDAPHPDRIHYRMSRCFLELKNFIQYRAELEYILQHYPASEWADDAALSLAESYYLQGQTEIALQKYQQFLRDYPQSPLAIQARFGVAKSLEESLRLEEAIKAYQALLPDYPNKSLIQDRLAAVEKRFQERNR
jgi:TolA-binding protein